MGGIRFLLACTVVLWHTSTIFGYQPIRSDLAVQCFYIISGFYMAMILNEKYPAGATKLFYSNRALKLYPLYWLILVLLVAWGIFVHDKGYPGTLRAYDEAGHLSPLTWIYLVIANAGIIGLDLLFLLGIQDGRLYLTPDFTKSRPAVYNMAFNSIGWTLGIEVLFYLIAPFLLRKRVFWVLVLFFASLGLRIALARNGLTGHPWDYMFFPTQLLFFMGGSLSYQLYLKVKAAGLSRRLLFAPTMLLFAVILFYAYCFNESYYKQTVLFTLLVLLIPAAFEWSRDSKFDRYLGNLSYPVYVSQMLVINMTRAHAFPKLFGIGFTTLGLVILLSMALYHLVTVPIEKIRQKRVTRAGLKQTGSVSPG